jgi:hypothetical protein
MRAHPLTNHPVASKIWSRTNLSLTSSRRVCRNSVEKIDAKSMYLKSKGGLQNILRILFAVRLIFAYSIEENG